MAQYWQAHGPLRGIVIPSARPQPPTFHLQPSWVSLLGVVGPHSAAPAIRARGVQLGIKKEPIIITGLIELKVFRVIFQANSGEMVSLRLQIRSTDSVCVRAWGGGHLQHIVPSK